MNGDAEYDEQEQEQGTTQEIGGYRLRVPRRQFMAVNPASGVNADTGPAAAPAERPSYGERIGAKLPAPVVPAAQPAATAPSKITEPTSPSQDPMIDQLIQRRAARAVPIRPEAVDPQGKPMYRMGWGQRILGTLANAAMGFGTKGQGESVYVGPGATNARYTRDVNRQQTDVGNLDTELAQRQKSDQEKRQMYEAATQGAYRQGQIERLGAQAAKYENAIDPQSIKQDADGKWFGTTYGGERKEVGEPAWSQKLTAQQEKPSKVATDVEDRTAAADRLGLKGRERRDYILTGKTASEMRGAGRQPGELEMWRQAFHEQYGRWPNADEIANKRRATRGTPAQFAKVEADKAAALRKAEKQYREDKQAGDPDAEENLRVAKQQAQGTYEQQIQTFGGTVGGNNSPPPSATQRQRYNAGDQVMYRGKPHRVVGKTPDGRLQLQPMGN